MAECAPPVSGECETKEHQAAKDLEILIKKWINSSQPLTDQNLSEDNDFTELLESYIGAGHHTELENITSSTAGYRADINVYNNNSEIINTCNVHLLPFNR